jgi:hypothetical protein
MPAVANIAAIALCRVDSLILSHEAASFHGVENEDAVVKTAMLMQRVLNEPWKACQCISGVAF